jgi:hypothetical protein
MKILFLITASVFLGIGAIASEKKTENKRIPSSVSNPTENVYVFKKMAVTGCANHVCDLKLKDMIATTPFLGMNLDADETLKQLEYDKLYSCVIKGGYVYGAKLFKVYEINNCIELTAKEFSAKISDKF